MTRCPRVRPFDGSEEAARNHVKRAIEVAWCRKERAHVIEQWQLAADILRDEHRWPPHRIRQWLARQVDILTAEADKHRRARRISALRAMNTSGQHAGFRGLADSPIARSAPTIR